MKALALRLEGPMQSWGGPVAGDDRHSLDVPTKSGVLGLIGSALGVERAEVEALVALHRGLALGVRVDRSGTRGIDFHTAQDVPRAERGVAETVVSRRTYLYDASFVAVLVEREDLSPGLDAILAALRRPRFAPFLGRRSCPPSCPILAIDGIVTGETWPSLLGQVPYADRTTSHDAFIEGEIPAAEHIRKLRVRDDLVGPLPRMFGERLVTHIRLTPPDRAGDTVSTWFPT